VVKRNIFLILCLASITVFVSCSADKTDKNSKDELYEQGVRASSDGKHEEAVIYYRKAVKEDKEFEDGWFKLGYAYERLNKFDDAVKSYTRVIELNEAAWDAWYSRGIAYAKQEKYGDALVNMIKANELNPNDARITDALARLYRLTGKEKKAEEVLRRFRQQNR